MATVALLGVPLIMYKDSDFRLQTCAHGATAKPRKDLERMLSEANPELTIVDLGELTGEIATRPSESDCLKLGLEVVKMVSESSTDIVLAIGGDHAAAFPFYSLPGQVVRADAHGDAYVQGSPLSSWQITGATYMAFVDSLRLKKPHQIWNVGVNTLMLQQEYYAKDGVIGALVDVPQMLRRPPLRVSLLDVDLDVLSQDYRLPHGHSTSNLKAEDLASLVTKLQPKVVGLFECVGWNGAIPQNIVSGYPTVFGPICKAVAEAAVARSRANGANLQSLPVSSGTYR